MKTFLKKLFDRPKWQLVPAMVALVLILGLMIAHGV